MSQGLLGANWGDGHATDAEYVNKLPANANPNAFYKKLMSAPYINNAIISTHIYGCVCFQARSFVTLKNKLNWFLGRLIAYPVLNEPLSHAGRQ